LEPAVYLWNIDFKYRETYFGLGGALLGIGYSLSRVSIVRESTI